MAQIANTENGRVVVLSGDSLVGRSSRCTLRIDDERVSSEHASIRWSGECWSIRDLGSLNKTMVDGTELLPGAAVPLRSGSEIVFGCAGQTWVVKEDAPPSVIATAEDDGTKVVAVDGLLALPSAEQPLVTVCRNRQGGWFADGEQGVLPMTDGSLIVAGGRAFRLQLPQAPVGTAPVKGFSGRRVADLLIKFRVSPDLEHIELELYSGGERHTFPARTHNEMLLILARTRRQDQLQEIPEANCGWMYQDELCRDIALDIARLNVDVYRLRQQFATLGLLDPANIIERRPRAKQVRIGIARVEEKPCT